jgi:hypothetical protein
MDLRKGMGGEELVQLRWQTSTGRCSGGKEELSVIDTGEWQCYSVCLFVYATCSLQFFP